MYLVFQKFVESFSYNETKQEINGIAHTNTHTHHTHKHTHTPTHKHTHTSTISLALVSL